MYGISVAQTSYNMDDRASCNNILCVECHHSTHVFRLTKMAASYVLCIKFGTYSVSTLHEKNLENCPKKQVQVKLNEQNKQL